MYRFLPVLANGGQSNLAGLLPLSALIEFVDVVVTLHMYELSGRGLLWNWPITPHGARLLLERAHFDADSRNAKAHACVLDTGEHEPPLHCVDMRWGDVYVCANRFTVRKCISVAPSSTIPDKFEGAHRLQYLEIVHISFSSGYRDPTVPPGDEESRAGRQGAALPRRNSLLQRFWHLLYNPHRKWRLSIPLWFLWIAVAVTCISSGCIVAFAYYIVLPLTGLVINILFGHHARRLADAKPSQWQRTVVVADHFNDTNWTLFAGNSNLVDSLLNKPLARALDESRRLIDPYRHTRLLRFILVILIAGQWGLVVAASALAEWDALFISFGILLCVATSALVFNQNFALNSWKESNSISIRKLRVTFSGRRAMLSALVALNPDSSTRWIDPILAPSEDRTRWEHALEKRISSGVDAVDALNVNGGTAFWMQSITEGVEQAKEIKKWLRWDGNPNSPNSAASTPSEKVVIPGK